MKQRARAPRASGRYGLGVSFIGFAAIAAVLGAAACSGDEKPGTVIPGNGSGGAGAGGDGASPGETPTPGEAPSTPPLLNPDLSLDPGAPAEACQGLECQQQGCAGGGKTTISGTVYDPGGSLALYNVMVYVPNAPLEPLSSGASCACEVSGSPIASAITDSAGRFVLENAPAGSDIPLVIQVGKWRRELTIPAVEACADTAVPDGSVRLPKDRTEGNLPRIALTTGNADALECLLGKLGIDDSEFTTREGGGSINYFAGHEGTDRFVDEMNDGARFPAASELWSSVDTLKEYDVVLLSCEGSEYPDEKGEAAFQAMAEYTNLGGRVFASHWHQVWLKEGPEPMPQIADFVDEEDLNDITGTVVTSFPKGQALSEWLVNVGASETPGKIDIKRAQYTVVSENPEYAQRWIENDDPPTVQYLSANTPLGVPAADQCGRVVLSDIHVSGGNTGDEDAEDTSDDDIEYPNGCVSTALSPQEKVLAFMLFDISGCLVPDTQPPAPPPVIVR
jgi:hypothetical protein